MRKGNGSGWVCNVELFSGEPEQQNDLGQRDGAEKGPRSGFAGGEIFLTHAAQPELQLGRAELDFVPVAQWRDLTDWFTIDHDTGFGVAAKDELLVGIDINFAVLLPHAFLGKLQMASPAAAQSKRELIG